MPFIESDLVKFILLVVPGVLGVWVYKPFAYKDHIPELWQHEMLQALMFGICGYLSAGLAYQYCSWIKSLGIVGSFLVSSLTSIIWGCIVGLLGRKAVFLTYLPASWHSKLTQLPDDKPHGRAFEHYYNEFFLKQKDRKNRTAVLMIYPVGHKELAEIGEFAFKADKYNEIGYDCYPHLNFNFFEENKSKISLWSKIINIDTGMVIEIASVEKDWFMELRQKEFDQYFN